MEQGYRGSQVNCFSIRADSQTFAGPLSFQAITIVLVKISCFEHVQISSFDCCDLSHVAEDLIVVREGEREAVM